MEEVLNNAYKNVRKRCVRTKDIGSVEKGIYVLHALNW